MLPGTGALRRACEVHEERQVLAPQELGRRAHAVHTHLHGPEDAAHDHGEAPQWSFAMLRGSVADTSQLPPPCFAVSRRLDEKKYELQSPCNLVCRLLLEKKKRSLYSTLTPLRCRASV